MKTILWFIAWAFVWTAYSFIHDHGHPTIAALLVGGFVGILIAKITKYD